MYKKYFLHLFAMMMVAMLSVSLGSCSSDDDVNSNELEGIWGLVHSEGYDYEDPEEPLEWNENHNPLNPNSYDDLKIEIINTNGNTYLITQYYWSPYSKTWQMDDTRITATLNGKTLILNGGFKGTILTLNSTQLVIERKEGNKYYVKETYRKLSSIGE